MWLKCSLLLIFIKWSAHSATNPQMVCPQVKNTDDNPPGPTLRIYIGNPVRFLGLPGCCFTAILTPTRQNGGMPQWTLGSVILPPIGTAAPQIPLSSKLKQAHQRAWKEAVRRCDRERGNKNEWEKNKKKPHLRNPWTWQRLIQINISEWWSVATILMRNILREDERLKVGS